MTSAKRKARIYYARLDEFWTKEQKLQHLDRVQSAVNVGWQEITPDEKHTWLTTGLEGEFDSFLLVGSRQVKEYRTSGIQWLFYLFSNGNDSGRDDWVYNFNKNDLLKNIKNFTDTYNAEANRWSVSDKTRSIDDFVINDEKLIKWTRNAKRDLRLGRHAEFSTTKIMRALYRPFTSTYLYSGKIFNKEVALFPKILPTPNTQKNKVICLTDAGSEKPFMVIVSNKIPDLHLVGAGCGTQSFPFYTYSEDGTNRRENITDWGLAQFRSHYDDDSISKWDLFHYVYAILHHPHYRDRYAANLKRELPRIPLVPYTGEGAQPTEFTAKPADLFWRLAKAGARLAEIHVHYEDQPEYPLKEIENPDEPLNLRVEKMRLSKDKTQIKYNDFLTLTGIPPEAFRYRLGNRSALDWIIDQYQVKTDKRSGITNDPNQLEDEGYVISLIKKVIRVSVETVAIVEGLPNIGLPNDLPKNTQS